MFSGTCFILRSMLAAEKPHLDWGLVVCVTLWTQASLHVCVCWWHHRPWWWWFLLCSVPMQKDKDKMSSSVAWRLWFAFGLSNSDCNGINVSQNNLCSMSCSKYLWHSMVHKMELPESLFDYSMMMVSELIRCGTPQQDVNTYSGNKGSLY